MKKLPVLAKYLFIGFAACFLIITLDMKKTVYLDVVNGTVDSVVSVVGIPIRSDKKDTDFSRLVVESDLSGAPVWKIAFEENLGLRNFVKPRYLNTEYHQLLGAMREVSRLVYLGQLDHPTTTILELRAASLSGDIHEAQEMIDAIKKGNSEP